MMNVEKAKSFAVAKFKTFSPKLVYHNLNHALDVAECTQKLGKLSFLSEEELNLLEIGAYYHDIGFFKKYIGHEDVSIWIVKRHLPDFGFNKSHISIISDMIEATKMPQKTKTKLEKILCDADLDNFGRDDFFSTFEKIFQEKMNCGYDISKHDFYKQTLEILLTHQYHTKIQQDLRNEKKFQNQKELEHIISEKI